ncbi:MAG: YitT family protein [Anaerolineales bacterium]
MAHKGWRRVVNALVDYLLIGIGAVLVGCAADLFFIPNKLASGGVVGIATMLYHTLGLPVGAMTLVMNIPLLIAAAVWGGGAKSVVRTLYALGVMSFTIDALAPYLPAVTRDPLLYAVYGGVMDGLGVGLVFRFGGTTGGVDIVANLLNRWRGVRLGTTILVANILILSGAAAIFGVELAMYALLVIIVSSRVVDLVQEGLAEMRSTFIVSSEAEEIARAINTRLVRGVTILEARGAYTGREQPVLLCAISQSEIVRLKKLVREIDPEAFLIVSPANEVLGAGFRSWPES